jgi:hypothetical protein
MTPQALGRVNSFLQRVARTTQGDQGYSGRGVQFPTVITDTLPGNCLVTAFVCHTSTLPTRRRVALPAIRRICIRRSDKSRIRRAPLQFRHPASRYRPDDPHTTTLNLDSSHRQVDLGFR